jgi:hypothetical protein
MARRSTYSTFVFRATGVFRGTGRRFSLTYNTRRPTDRRAGTALPRRAGRRRHDDTNTAKTTNWRLYKDDEGEALMKLRADTVTDSVPCRFTCPGIEFAS